MRRTYFTPVLAACGLFAAALLPNARAIADDNQCPANSHAVSETANEVLCKCNDPLIDYNGKCQYREAIEDRLQQRILASLKGIKAASDAISSERSGLVYGAIRKHFAAISVSAGMAILSKNPMVMAPEALSLSNDLGSLLGEWKACTSTPDLKTSCDNLHNFQRILHETATQLIAVQKK